MRRARAVLPALLLAGGALLAALSLASAPGVAQDLPHWTDQVHRVVLSNGLTVLMFPRGGAPIVSVQAMYKLGSRNDPPGMKGTAHYVEHMAFRSTEGIAKADLTNQIVRWGGHWNGYTSYDRTTYASAVPSRFLEWTMILERERLSRVVFTEDEVSRERTSVIAELHEYEDWPPYTLIDHRLRPMAFPSHPYGAPIMGGIDDLNRVTSDELRRFYRRFYAANNLVLVIVGEFEPSAAIALVRTHFDDAPAGGDTPDIRVVEPPQDRARRTILQAPGRVSHLEIAVQAPAVGDSDFATLLIVDAILAGGRMDDRVDAKQDSTLERALVRSGLATSVSTEIEASQYPGLYSIGVEAPAAADLSKAEAAVSAAIATLRSVGPEDVARAARHVRSAMLLEADSNGAFADLLARFEATGSYHRLATLDADLGRVTPATVKSFASSRLAPSRWNVGVFRPEAIAPKAPSPVARPAAPPAAPAMRVPGMLVPPGADLATPALPSIVTMRLPNGLTVVAVDESGEIASLSVRIEAGARYDPADRPGTAVMTGRLLGSTAATGVPAGPTLEGALRRLDATLVESAFELDAARANRSVLELDVRVPRTGLQSAVELVADRIARPSYQQAQLNDARDLLLAELEAVEDDSAWRATRAALERLYPSSRAYGQPPEADASALRAIALADIQAFHDRRIRPDRTVIAVAGGRAEDAVKSVIHAFGDWQKAPGDRAGSTRDEAPRPAAGGRVHVSLPHKEQASVVVALPGLGPTQDDYVPLRALNYLLGETGYAGRLGQTLVDTGIAYAVYATLSRDPEGGPVLIQTNTVNPAEAVTRILDTLASFTRDGVTDAERLEAQGYLLGRLPFRFESASSATRALADLARTGRSAEWNAFAEKVRALTTADLERVAAIHYDQTRAVVAVAGR